MQKDSFPEKAEKCRTEKCELEGKKNFGWLIYSLLRMVPIFHISASFNIGCLPDPKWTEIKSLRYRKILLFIGKISNISFTLQQEWGKSNMACDWTFFGQCIYMIHAYTYTCVHQFPNRFGCCDTIFQLESCLSVGRGIPTKGCCNATAEKKRYCQFRANKYRTESP